MKPLMIALLSTLLLSSCASVSTKKPPQNAPSSDATIKLALAADAVSQSLNELARIQAVATPAVRGKSLPASTTYQLQTHASVDWSGPIKELVSSLAKTGNYRLRVLGKAPAIPVLITLSEQDKSLATILRNIDYQAGKRASIKVYPRRRTIELRYA